MIAILTNNIDFAITQLRREGSLYDYHPTTRKGQFTSGREFLLVSEPAHLEAVNLTDYRVVGCVNADLIEMARTRMVVR
jgi:hypothetical protein